jgi:aminopeptidase N
MPEIQLNEKIVEHAEKEFAFCPADFGKLPVTVEHFNLVFDVFDKHTVVESEMTMTVIEPFLQKISLDAKNLEIQEVALYEKVKEDNKPASKKSIPYIYDTENNKLHITLPQKKAGETFTIYTKTITKPTKNILEGLYYDETPHGCPPTQITQCQQWGFQRLVPCFDDMTAKCTYTTTIIADSRYTNMISNGDIAPEYKNGKKNVGNNRSMIQYVNHKTPMAPYLFFLCVGTYKTVKREFEYPDGKIFMLELLIPPHADNKEAENALDILQHGIMWIHLHTGSHAYDALDVKKKIWRLLKKRDFLKARNQDVKEVRKELAELVNPLHLGYKYTGQVYREIGMQNSNFGGMENVGNTTIVTNRIMPTPYITDDSFEYMMEVKAHEFYHNLNGSEVTGIDPFMLWLNEAVTVHIESQYLSHIMGDAYTRIVRVLTLHSPVWGTFAEDNSPAALPIIPQGFNTPDELITGMTYIKAPEFVQMIETLIGKEKFAKALAVYHEKFKHKNANTDDWLNVMKEMSGIDFKDMAKTWLTRSGFPRVSVKTEYENGKCIIHLQQKGFDKEPWQFPFIFCPVDKQGKDMGKNTVYWVKNEIETIEISVKEEPAYVSLNRNHALYGKVSYENQTQEQLILQALKDSDIINRYMAFSTLLDKEKVTLINNINADISKEVIATYGKILSDEKLTPEVKTLFLLISENVREESLSFKYKEIYAAKEKLRKTIASAYKKQLKEMYTSLASKRITGTYLEQQFAGMKLRGLKNHALHLLASFDDEESWKLIKHQLNTTTHASDRNHAMGLYLNSSAPDKLVELDIFKKEAEKHLVAWENFLRIVGNSNSADAIEVMKKIEKDPHFRIEQSNELHSLYLTFAANRKKSLLTPEGREYLKEIMIAVSKLNEYTGFILLSAFNDLNNLNSEDQVALVDVLYAVRNSLSKKECASVYNNIQRILKKCPKAVAAWKSKKE